jgi:FKBP-type peptidyl-prolyl cis-trans isomerase
MVLGIACLAPSAWAGGPKLESEDEKLVYALGLAVARNVEPYSLSKAELQIFLAGITDGASKAQPKISLDEYMAKFRGFAEGRMKVAADAEKKDSEEYLKKAAEEKGAVKTDSGLVLVEITPGTGESPKATDTVKVSYTGKLRDGTVFDASSQHGGTATFQLNQVIPCWTEGLQKMKVGGKSKLVCPSSIAYKDRGSPPKIKPGATLTFEVELLEVSAAPPKPAAAPAQPGTGAAN